MYVSGHHQATTGVMCVGQSYATVRRVPCFPHCPPLFCAWSVYPLFHGRGVSGSAFCGSKIPSTVVAREVAQLTFRVVHYTHFNPNRLSIFLSDCTLHAYTIKAPSCNGLEKRMSGTLNTYLCDTTDHPFVCIAIPVASIGLQSH